MSKVILSVMAMFGLLALILVLSFIGAYPTMWVVNYLIAPSALTAVFGTTTLTFWKAFWLNYITAALFKSTNISNREK